MLTSASIPSHLNLKFDPQSKVFYSVSSEGAVIRANGWYSRSIARTLNIPSQLDGKPVVKIDNASFMGNYDGFSSVSFPSTLKEIGSYAFMYTNLRGGNIDLPASLTKI